MRSEPSLPTIKTKLDFRYDDDFIPVLQVKWFFQKQIPEQCKIIYQSHPLRSEPSLPTIKTKLYFTPNTE